MVQPLILGPFTGEPTYEIQAWVPYLREVLGDQLKDCIAISRGGTDAWYPCTVLNAYDVVSVEEYSELWVDRYESTEKCRPEEGNDLDRLILERFGLKSDIHPSVLWNPKTNRLKGWYERLQEVERLPGLPDKYVAVRMYANDWFMNKQIAVSLDCGLPIVGLKIKNPPDNHIFDAEYNCDKMVVYEPHHSFKILSSVIGHAEKLICPYGGMMYLGLGYGIEVDAYADNKDPAESWHAGRDQEIVNALGGTLNIFTCLPEEPKPAPSENRWMLK